MKKIEDYKERFKIEYLQTKGRYDKLNKMLAKYEANALDFTPTCGINILKKQAKAMGEYLYCLKVRAVIEDVDLSEPLNSEV